MLNSEVEEAVPATIFIPQEYLKWPGTEIIVCGALGYGIEIEAAKLGEYIRSGRIASSIVPNNFVAVIHETAVPKDT